jgi:hypothetical protein
MKTKNIIFAVGVALIAVSLITTNALYAVGALAIAGVWGAREVAKGRQLS